MTALIVGYMFLFVFRPFEVWPQLAPLHMERVYMIGALLFFVFAEKNQGVTRSLHYYILWLCALIVLAPLYSPYSAAALGQVDEYLRYLVFYIMLLYGIRSREELEKVLVGFLAVMLVYEGKSLWEFLINGRMTYRMGIVRMVGIDQAYSDPNTFAASIDYALPIAFLFLRYRSQVYARPLVLWGVMILLIISVACLVFTGSRSGQTTFLLLLLLEWFRSKRKILLAAGFGAVLIAIWTYMPLEYKDRFESIWNPAATDPTAEESAEDRIKGLEDGYNLLQLRPLFGFGAGTFEQARGLVGDLKGLQAHNLYGEVMGELGIAGTTLLLFICVSIIRLCRKLYCESRLEAGAAANFDHLLSIAVLQVLLLLLFEGNFGHNLYRYTWLWISAFLMLAVHFRSKHKASLSEQAADAGQGG